MAIALVSSLVAGSSDGSGFTSASMDTTGANFLVVAFSFYNVTSPTVSDSKGNTWTALTTRDDGVVTSTKLFYVANATVGTGHTFTLTGSGSYASLAAAAFSGVKTTSPFDVENGSATATPGSITPSENNELVITSCSTGGILGDAPSAPTGGFTITNSITNDATFHFGLALAYLIQTTAAAANPTWTTAPAASEASAIASFKASAASTANSNFLLFM